MYYLDKIRKEILGGGGKSNLTILFDFYPEKFYDQLEFNKL